MKKVRAWLEKAQERQRLTRKRALSLQAAAAVAKTKQQTNKQTEAKLNWLSALVGPVWTLTVVYRTSGVTMG